jgi:hypothetical protein
MKNRKLAGLGPIQLAGIALLASIVSALLVLLTGRLWNGAQNAPAGTAQSSAGTGSSQPASDIDTAGVERIPPQPEVDMAMPADVPTHFTEEIVIPGFTETGADVERDDDTLGRSPEGV